MLLPTFTRRRVRAGEVALHAAVGGDGPPLVLLHGYPQTHVAWHAVAPRLAERFTVVCPDLRGYGTSDKPPGDPDHQRYAKRAMGGDVAALMAALGHDRFAAQPADFPERLIGADPELFLTHTLRAWCGHDGAITGEALAAYREAFANPRTIHATCEDYRAGATADVAHDAADRDQGRRIQAPLLLLWGQPPGLELPFDPLAVWRRWAGEVDGRSLPCGHFLAEERPTRSSTCWRSSCARRERGRGGAAREGRGAPRTARWRCPPAGSCSSRAARCTRSPTGARCRCGGSR